MRRSVLHRSFPILCSSAIACALAMPSQQLRPYQSTADQIRRVRVRARRPRRELEDHPAGALHELQAPNGRSRVPLC